jgi:hypothetical protein
MAVLEYYAFEARSESDHAAKSYRLLARKGFRDFIYAYVGYNPKGESSIAWSSFTTASARVPHRTRRLFQHFQGTASADRARGAIADVFVMLIRSGANLGPSFVPDISVGQLWSIYWLSENLDIVCGDRIKYAHNYPLYYPQSASNPQHPGFGRVPKVGAGYLLGQADAGAPGGHCDGCP